MKIKKNCKASVGDFWYDLTDGGYLNPKKICAKKKDAERVLAAVEVIKEFYDSCVEQVEDFIR